MQLIKFKSEKEWLAARKKHIGASDASIIMGASKWKLPDGRIKTPRLLWREKLGMENLSCDNAATRYGKEMEAPAREAYEVMVGDLFKPICVKNPKYPHLMVSLDGLNKDRTKAVEIKNGNKEDHELARSGKIPPKYIPQVVTQLIVSEVPVDYFSFHNEEGIIVKVERDDAYIKDLEKKLERFWDCVQELKPPPLTEDDYIERDHKWHTYAHELHEVKCKKKELCLKEKELQEKLELLSHDHNARSGQYLFARYTSQGRVDYKSIPELKNVVLDDFRDKPIVSWRLKKVED